MSGKAKFPSQHEMDQLSAASRDLLVPLFASVFRAFCKEEGISRAEALQLTVGYMASVGKGSSGGD